MSLGLKIFCCNYCVLFLLVCFYYQSSRAFSASWPNTLGLLSDAELPLCNPNY